MKYVLIYKWVNEETGMVYDYGVKPCETLEEVENVKREQEEYFKDMIELGRLKLYIAEVK